MLKRTLSCEVSCCHQARITCSNDYNIEDAVVFDRELVLWRVDSTDARKAGLETALWSPSEAFFSRHCVLRRICCDSMCPFVIIRNY